MNDNKEDTLNELTELPKYFIIKNDKSTLYKKYLNWLCNKYYHVIVEGAFDYYGYVDYEFFRKDFITSIEDKLLITLEQWDKIVNKKDEFVLPEKWCIKGYEEVAKYSNVYGSMPPYIEWLSSYHHYPSYGNRCTTSAVVKAGYIEITLEQFKTHVLKQNNNNNMKENQEIIGYKLVKSYAYGEAAKIIGDFKNLVAFEHYKTISLKENIEEFEKVVNKLKEAGVLDLWFSPCYKPKYELPKINGHSGKFENDIIVYGNNCARFDKEFFIELNKISIDCNSDNVRGYSKEHNIKIQSITLDSGVIITIDKIKQIVDYINNNK